jgi:hypothetical protein
MTRLDPDVREGNAPDAAWIIPGQDTMFSGDNDVTVYYLPGTTGWGSTFGGAPTALWALPYPPILNSVNNNTSFGVQNKQFGFTVSWATNLSIIVQASTNLASPIWIPVSTNALASGSFYFSDPQWTNYPSRFYRLCWP